MSNNSTTPASFYQKLVFMAYGFYMLLGVVWMVMNLIFGHYFNVQALLVVAIFAAQAYYRHRLANLLLGIVLLFISIFSVLEFLALGGKTGFDTFVYTMIASSLLSMAMAGVLIFAYLKIAPAGQQ